MMVPDFRKIGIIAGKNLQVNLMRISTENPEEEDFRPIFLVIAGGKLIH